MAERNGEEEKEVTQKPKGFRLMKWIILAALIAVIGGGAYAAWVFYFQGNADKPAEVEQPVEKATFSMDTFLVNLADPGGKRYLKVSMNLVVTSAQTVEEFTARNSELRDVVLMLLSSKKYDDIATYAGKTTLKQEIIAQLNRKLTQGQAEDVYFTEFLVQ